MGFIHVIECGSCGFNDSICDRDPGHFAGVGMGEMYFFSKKTKLLINMKMEDVEKYADKKFCAFDIENKDKYEWTREFEISELKCPKCRKINFKLINIGET